jgi:hypothetical protein
MQTQTFSKNPAALFNGVIVNNELAKAYYAPGSELDDKKHEANAADLDTKAKTCKPTRNPCCKPTKDTKDACCGKKGIQQAQPIVMDLMMV